MVHVIHFMNINAISNLEMINRHIYKSFAYDRNKGVLLKSDYEFMRDSLESYLAHIQSLDTDNHEEIDRLKLLFIKLDHQIDRMR